MGFTVNGDSTYHTIAGGFATKGYGILAIAYAVLQFYVMVTYGSTSFQSSTVKNFFKTTDVYQSSFSEKPTTGFNLAFMMSDKSLAPMPNFDKIARFELVNNFVNLDYFGEYEETY